MNAETQAPPVDAAHIADYFREVESFQAQRTRGARRTARAAIAVAALSLLANVALAFAVASMLPLERLVPLPMWVHADGTVDVLPKMSDLPPTQGLAVTRAAIWQYVRDRQGYDFADARYRYDVVSMMSAADVRDAYQQWFLPGDRASPQNTVGRRGQIDLRLVNMSFVRPQVALVRYERRLLMYGEAPETTTWTATVGFARVGSLPAEDRLADPGGIIVTNYQDSEDSAP